MEKVIRKCREALVAKGSHNQSDKFGEALSQMEGYFVCASDWQEAGACPELKAGVLPSLDAQIHALDLRVRAKVVRMQNVFTKWVACELIRTLAEISEPIGVVRGMSKVRADKAFQQWCTYRPDGRLAAADAVNIALRGQRKLSAKSKRDNRQFLASVVPLWEKQYQTAVREKDSVLLCWPHSINWAHGPILALLHAFPHLDINRDAQCLLIVPKVVSDFMFARQKMCRERGLHVSSPIGEIAHGREIESLSMVAALWDTRSASSYRTLDAAWRAVQALK